MASRALQPFEPPLPQIAIAQQLLARFRVNDLIDLARLRALFSHESGCSDATGLWSMRQAYDALELAKVLFLSDPDCPLVRDDRIATLSALETFDRSLPTQSYRSEMQVERQQFSTPAPLAYLAGLAAQLNRSDTVLEPSAGNGMLAWPARRAGCNLILNELDDERRTCLAHAWPRFPVSGHDGELIDDLLAPEHRPSVVLINPPFARSIGRGVDRHAAARHLTGAYRRLATGGRVIAIMPPGFEVASWMASVRLPSALRLDALLAPRLFARQGTSVAVRLVAIDKLDDDRPTSSPNPATLAELLLAILGLPSRTTTHAPPHPVPVRASLFRGLGAAVRAVLPTPARQLLMTEVAAQPLSVEPLDEPAPLAEQAGLYLPWRASRLCFADAVKHPTPLVESVAMGSIAAPKAAHRPLLPPSIVGDGVLSAAQLETLVYAGAAFERELPGTFLPASEGCALAASDEGRAYRMGFFLGDGTGAGKGRQIAGVILDQWLRGNRRHIWISKNEALLEDARRDWTALGGLALDVQPLSQWKLGVALALDAGILFVTYPILRSGREDAIRLAQILNWAGDEFDGVVAFDEAHAMANALGGDGSRGKIKGSEQGIAGLRLQNLLPRARVLYASATGASDIANLSYAARLGLWGPATAFADRNAFVASIRAGGIAAMELVARDLKALGLYLARALSFAGVEYEALEHKLTPEQIAIYDAYAEAWAIIHRHLDDALEATRIVDSETSETLNANAKSAALSRFEGTKQRFFAQLLLSCKLPTLLPAIEGDLDDGNAVVVQLVSTAEAMLDRRLAELSADERERLELDLSPREYVIDYLLSAFPTRQMRVFTDAEGNRRSEPMNDSEGRPVHCRGAITARDMLVEQLCALPPIGTALDMIIERFGTDAVAEVTGRTRRLITDKRGMQKLETRSARANLIETQSFMDGTKRILVFSDAGGTGRSYHASLDAKNQARRIHYLLEPGWRADAAIQGLGRTHRSAQASAPMFRPVTTDVRGERRFISTIARRLDALGALTRGQRQTGGQNLFDPADNLESAYAKDALTSWYRLLYAGKLTSTTFADFQQRSGLKLEASDGGLREDLPPIQRWLNRILAHPIAVQNAIFDEYTGLIEARVSATRAAGTLDLGLETLAVERFDIVDDRIVRTDAVSGATTHLLRVEIARRPKVTRLETAIRLLDARAGVLPLVNRRSGKTALRTDARSLLSEEGVSIGRYELLRPGRREYLTRDQFVETSWEPVGRDKFAARWDAEAHELAQTLHRETMYLATGLLLPVWDKLPQDHVQVLRLVAADGGSLFGRAVPIEAVAPLSASLGLDIALALAPAELAATVLRAGQPQPLGRTGLMLKRALVNGSQRLELIAFEPARLGEYKALGCFTEIIRYQTRLFVPVDRAADILTRVAA